jgi:hypothetical protein
MICLIVLLIMMFLQPNHRAAAMVMITARQTTKECDVQQSNAGKAFHASKVAVNLMQ